MHFLSVYQLCLQIVFILLIRQVQHMNLSETEGVSRVHFPPLYWQSRPVKPVPYLPWHSYKWPLGWGTRHVSPYFGEWVVSVRALCSVNSSSCFLVVDVFGISGKQESTSKLSDFCSSTMNKLFTSTLLLLVHFSMPRSSVRLHWGGNAEWRIPKQFLDPLLKKFSKVWNQCSRWLNKNKKSVSIFCLLCAVLSGLHTSRIFVYGSVKMYRFFSCQTRNYFSELTSYIEADDRFHPVRID